MRFFRKLWSDERGEDVAEYALVLGFVAIAAIIGIIAVGDQLEIWWNGLAATVAGIPNA